MFHLVSLSFANFPGSGVVLWCLVGVCLGFVFLVVFSLPGNSASNKLSKSLEFPVVDRPCLVGPARHWLQRYSRSGSKWWQQKAPQGKRRGRDEEGKSGQRGRRTHITLSLPTSR